MGTGKQKNEKLESILRSAGLRLTKPRLEVAEIVLGKKGSVHVSSSEIWDKLKNKGSTISRATVYNTLNDFVSRGIMEFTNLGHKHVFDSNTEDHDHALDAKSGETFDIPPMQYLRKKDIIKGYKVKQVVLIIEKHKK